MDNHEKYNGRIDLKTPDTSKLFDLYDKIPNAECTTFRNPTTGLWNDTILSSAFFSKENVQIIQNGIRMGVYQRSNNQYIIDDQNSDSIKVVMRSIFLQNSKHSNDIDITTQISKLNNLVLKYCIHQVYGEAKGYMKYLSDVSTLAVPISHPVMSNTNDKQLELKTWF